MPETISTPEGVDFRPNLPSPGLRAAIEALAGDLDWAERVTRFGATLAWAATGAWIPGQQTADVNALQAQVTVYKARSRTPRDRPDVPCGAAGGPGADGAFPLVSFACYA